jgi:hypothetical protein
VIDAAVIDAVVIDAVASRWTARELSECLAERAPLTADAARATKRTGR